MPVYEYKAFTATGESKVGVIDADTPRDARLKLRRDRVHVVEIQAVEDKAKSKRGRRRARAQTVLPKKKLDLVSGFTRQIATMLAAGIPLTESLRATTEQQGSKPFKNALLDVREKITQGVTFGDAVAFHPEWFDELYVNMIRAGEAAGNLDVVLHRLADFTANQRTMRDKVSAALTYPAVMLVIGGLVVAVLMAFVVPKITETLISQRGEDTALPWPTALLMGASDFLSAWWWAMTLGIAALSSLYGRAYNTPTGRLAIDRFWLGFPVVGELLRKAAVSRFAVTFSTLLGSGVPTIQCLQITESVVGNRVLSDALGRVREAVIEGSDIATPLRQTGVFPPLVGYMVAVGEQSGELENLLERIAKSNDEDVEISTQKMTSLIEPILIVFLAVIVGFIVLAIMWPILEMSTGAGI